MDQSARIGMRLREPQAHDDRFVRPLRVQRLPGIGEGALAEMRLEARGNVGFRDTDRHRYGSSHAQIVCCIIGDIDDKFTAYKV
jgi:hypothetical protein